MATRLQHWDKLEAQAKAFLAALEASARDRAWTDADIERWDKVHDALMNRPRLSLAERDRLSGRFVAPPDTGET